MADDEIDNEKVNDQQIDDKKAGYDIEHRLKGRYILTYKGSKDEFNKEYLDFLQKNKFEPVKYIPLSEKTIIIVNDTADINCTENRSGLEERLKKLYSEKLSVEKDREYKAR
jgi:hypothetical protein